MVNWILIIIGLFILAVLYIKFEHAGKRIKFIILALFLFFLLASATIVISSAGVKLNSMDGILKAAGTYFSWLYHATLGLWNAGGEISKTVGNAIKLNATG